jgi:hypothetical protein
MRPPQQKQQQQLSQQQQQLNSCQLGSNQSSSVNAATTAEAATAAQPAAAAEASAFVQTYCTRPISSFRTYSSFLSSSFYGIYICNIPQFKKRCCESPIIVGNVESNNKNLVTTLYQGDRLHDVIGTPPTAPTHLELSTYANSHISYNKLTSK